jgi:hypothetical protein
VKTMKILDVYPGYCDPNVYNVIVVLDSSDKAIDVEFSAASTGGAILYEEDEVHLAPELEITVLDAARAYYASAIRYRKEGRTPPC